MQHDVVRGVAVQLHFQVRDSTAPTHKVLSETNNTKKNKNKNKIECEDFVRAQQDRLLHSCSDYLVFALIHGFSTSDPRLSTCLQTKIMPRSWKRQTRTPAPATLPKTAASLRPKQLILKFRGILRIWTLFTSPSQTSPSSQ